MGIEIMVSRMKLGNLPQRSQPTGGFKYIFTNKTKLPVRMIFVNKWLLDWDL